MALMTHRTSFALDETTIRRMKELARRWGVSQAEVLRRLVNEAAARADDGVDPVDRLKRYHARGGLASGTAEAYLGEVRRGRADWTRDR
jgi:hypothetical protein